MQGGGQQQNSDHTANFFWLIILICLTMMAIWWLSPGLIVKPIFAMRHAELQLVLFIADWWDPAAMRVHWPLIDQQALRHLDSVIVNADPATVHFEYFAHLNAAIGGVVRWVVALILGILSVFAFFSHSTVMFRQTHNMDSLKKLERRNWPQIEPVVALDLVKKPLEEGPWAMAKTPLAYCQERNMAKPIEKGRYRVWGLETALAAHALSLQLGPMWGDAAHLPIHVKALIVIFVAKAEKQKEVVRRFLGQISQSASTGQLDFSGVEAAFQTTQQSRLLAWLRPRHAYVRTMMASLLEIARADGVLASAEFLWLKPVDRSLWYMLNSVGRQTAVVEVAGAFAHWKAERVMKRAIRSPMVKEAVTALEAALADLLYVDKGDVWHTKED